MSTGLRTRVLRAPDSEPFDHQHRPDCDVCGGTGERTYWEENWETRLIPADHLTPCRACYLPQHLTTIETSRPGWAYRLLDHGPVLDVHLAGETPGNGTGRILCGFDRFAANVGFSVGGGTTGGRTIHVPCHGCLTLIADRPVYGLHAALFDGARCDDRGPRIGEDCPRCRLLPGHNGRHRPSSSDGWREDPTW